MEMKLRQTQKQTIVITQRLRQALKLLTLPTLELREELKTELQTNPLLEEVDEIDATPSEETEPPESEDGKLEEVDWEKFLEDGTDFGSAPAPERMEEVTEPGQVSIVSMTDSLRQQLYLKRLGEEDDAVLEFLLGSLDDRGYLTLTDEEIVEHTATEPERLKRLVGYLQECEPAGVGARDLRECLSASASSSSSASRGRRPIWRGGSWRSTGTHSRTTASPISGGR